MTIRTLPGNHLEIFISSEQLHGAATALKFREIDRKLVSKGHMPFNYPEEDQKLTLRDSGTVIRFRTEEELKGIV